MKQSANGLIRKLANETMSRWNNQPM